jgi:hypothetical protein
LLLLRSWSLFTHRRAKYLLEKKDTRWRGVLYAGAAFFAYPIDRGKEKFQTFARALLGDSFYRDGKRIIRSRLRVRG